MEIIVYFPETAEKQKMFDSRVAKFHAEYVAQCVEKLSCPYEQKIKLLDAVAKTIAEGADSENT